EPWIPASAGMSGREEKWRVSAPRPQAEVGDPDGEVEPGLAGHRQRLQRDGAVRAADQHIAAEPDRYRRFAASAHVIAGERAAAGHRTVKHTPDHAARRGRADVG